MGGDFFYGETIQGLRSVYPHIGGKEPPEFGYHIVSGTLAYGDEAQPPQSSLLPRVCRCRMRP